MSEGIFRKSGLDGSDSDAVVPRDRMLALLAHPYRRAVLRHRRYGTGPFHLADIAHDIVEEEGPDGATARSVYIALYHVHAPKLASTEILSFDSSEKLVSFAE